MDQLLVRNQKPVPVILDSPKFSPSFLHYSAHNYAEILGSFRKSAYICSRRNKNVLMSPVFRRESEYTFKIYSNEEEHLHIHVTHDRCEAKYWLEPEVELAKNTGFSEHELNKIKKLVEKYADKFKEQFRQHVGKRIDD